MRSSEAHTGIYFITYSEAGHEFTYFRKGSAASKVTPADVPEGMLKSCKLLHVSGISQAISESACDAVFCAINVARQDGAKVSYDPNLRLKLWGKERAKAIIHATVALCDIFLPSYDDVAELTGLNDPDALVEFYHEIGAKIVILKLGKGRGAGLGKWDT